MFLFGAPRLGEQQKNESPLANVSSLNNDRFNLKMPGCFEAENHV
jgi:hypothetical protein